MRFALQVVLAVALLASPVRAGDVWNPLTGLYVVPLEPAAPLAPGEGCRLGAQLGVLNHLSYDEGEWGEIVVNLEEWRLDLSAQVGLPAGLELGARLGVRALWGGLLDAPLDAYHRFLGVPANPAGEQNRVLLYARVEGSEVVLERSVIGLSDPVVWAGGREGIATWRLLARLPLGDPLAFQGAGFPVLGASLDVDGGWLGAGALLSFPTSDLGIVPGLRLRPSLSGRLWWQPGWAWLGFLRGARLEVRATSSPLVTGGEFAGIGLGLTVSVGPVRFTEDLAPGQPDVVLEGGLSLPCG